MSEHQPVGISFRDALGEVSRKLDQVIGAQAEFRASLAILPDIRDEVSELRKAIFDPETGVRPRVASVEMRLTEQIKACEQRRALEEKLDQVSHDVDTSRRDARRTWWINVIGWVVVLVSTMLAVYETRK